MLHLFGAKTSRLSQNEFRDDASGSRRRPMREVPRHLLKIKSSRWAYDSPVSLQLFSADRLRGTVCPLRLTKYPSGRFLGNGSHEPNACNLTARFRAVTRDLARLPRAMRLAS